MMHLVNVDGQIINLDNVNTWDTTTSRFGTPGKWLQGYLGQGDVIALDFEDAGTASFYAWLQSACVATFNAETDADLQSNNYTEHLLSDLNLHDEVRYTNGPHTYTGIVHAIDHKYTNVTVIRKAISSTKETIAAKQIIEITKKAPSQPEPAHPQPVTDSAALTYADGQECKRDDVVNNLLDGHHYQIIYIGDKRLIGLQIGSLGYGDKPGKVRELVEPMGLKLIHRANETKSTTYTGEL